MPQAQTLTPELAYDESPVELPTGLVFIPRETNRTHLQAALAAAGLTAKAVFPCDTRAAFALLATIGYRVDRPVLDYCLSREYIEPPQKEGGAFQWREKDVIAFADALENMRRWQPLHPSHVHKLTPAERTEHMVEASKRKAAMGAFVQMELNELLNLLAQCEDRETRDMMVCAIKIQTGLIHVRGNEQPEPPRTDTN